MRYDMRLVQLHGSRGAPRLSALDRAVKVHLPLGEVGLAGRAGRGRLRVMMGRVCVVLVGRRDLSGRAVDPVRVGAVIDMCLQRSIFTQHSVLGVEQSTTSSYVLARSRSPPPATSERALRGLRRNENDLGADLGRERVHRPASLVPLRQDTYALHSAYISRMCACSQHAVTKPPRNEKSCRREGMANLSQG